MKTLLIIIGLLFLSLPASATWTKVQSKGGSGSTRCDTNGGTSTTLACSFGTLPTVGNLIIAFCYYDDFNGTVTATVTDNQSNSYTKRVTSAEEATHGKTTISDGFAATSSGTFTTTCTFSAATFAVLHIYEWSGSATSAAFDQTGSNASTSTQTTTTVSTAGSTAVANELVMAGHTWGGAGAVPVAGTGFTLGESTTITGTTVYAGVEEYSTLQPSNSPGTQTATLTIGNTQPSGYSAGIATYKPPTAATTQSNIAGPLRIGGPSKVQ